MSDLNELIQNLKGAIWHLQIAKDCATTLVNQSPYADNDIFRGIHADIERQLAVLQRNTSEADDTIDGNTIMRHIDEAIEQKRLLRLTYISAKGERSERTVKAISIQSFRGHDSLTAWCHEKDAMRHFRLDRIESLRFDGDGTTRSTFSFTGAQIGASFSEMRRPRRSISLV